jgi:hypothetical protein
MGLFFGVCSDGFSHLHPFQAPSNDIYLLNHEDTES